jgi:hypothetical protein
MPRVQMTPMTKVALYFLRAYLIFLVILVLVRFLKGFG